MPVKRSTVPLIELSENHRRSISISLQLVDQALCEWDDWANGKVRSGIMYRQLDTLSAIQRRELQNKIGNVRNLMTHLRDDLDLEWRTVATSQSIVGRASSLWEMLTELNSHGLQAYGRVPEELTHYLDPIGEELARQMNETISLFSKPITGPIKL
jgi:hypothetical protein